MLLLLIIIPQKFSDLPVIIIPSHPARLSSVPKLPPAYAWATVPVSGDIDITAIIPEEGDAVSVRGPVKKRSGFSGESQGRWECGR
jgi:hypothetical protein